MNSKFFSALNFCLLALFLSLPSASWAASSVWTSNEPLGGGVYQIVTHPSQPQIIYVRTYNGLFKSTDSGGSWSHINSGLEGGELGAIAISPSNPTTLYGFIEFAFYRSFNSGESWQHVPNHNIGNLYNAQIAIISVDPTNPAKIYAGGYDSFFGINVLAKSTDGGDTWSGLRKGLPTYPSVKSIVIDPANPSTLYVGMGGSGYIYKSVDSGENWSPANNGLPSSDKFVLTFNDLIIDPNNPATLYAAVRFNKFCVCLDGENNGVFKTTDGGANWKQISNIKISALAIDRKSPALLYAVGGGRVLMSSNGGVSWRSVANEAMPAAARTLLIDPSNADSLYVGTTGGGVYKFTGAPVTSTDCLFNWAETNYADLFAPASPGSAVSDIYSYRYYSTSNTYLGVSSANNHVYFIGLDGIFQDQGSQWDWLPKAGCPVPDAQRDCVFSWAEKNYPGLFAPAAVSTNQTGVYTYRYYPATKTYLGVSSLDSHIYYLAADGNLQDEGLFYNWLDPSSCQ